MYCKYIEQLCIVLGGVDKKGIQTMNESPILFLLFVIILNNSKYYVICLCNNLIFSNLNTSMG
jgi:hypothetical protein